MPVVTLVSARARADLADDLAAMAARLVGGAVDWLEPAVACDLHLEAAPDAAVLAELRARCGEVAIDCVVQEVATRRKRILLADMDSTMIEQECIDELAAEVGIKDRVAAITARAMNGEIAFEPALRERVALLKGLSEGVVDAVIKGRITLAPGGRELVATMRANRAHTALISGGFTVFTTRIAAMLGFDENRANRLRIAAGTLTGEVEEPILGREAKLAALLEIAELRGLTPADAIVVGDGANDLAMIEAAGTGVALHAKPAVAAAAPHRIDHADLTALLFMQGYRGSEITG
ncbi:phosphoserine phosphatase SerB [Mangrovibrevibacter kandeliae]|uniref:phosphoserine phosphatase SerB n=1 Tax=Mangrovibrevibacter kandeliae TaxID=2968473 RepID=UPI00211978C9|nr:phosphoserine phosphatase SerB [Aurantimonas sp. CSK15Z-1]MCQ8781250.1 phosphoserine phosphatase SerB [Aurantimonas sp. CSK15Z-1]